MKQTNYGYGLDQQVAGMSMEKYLSELMEKNEKEQITVERAKVAVGIANARTKYSRALMDAVSLDAKLARKDAEIANTKAELAEAKLELEKSKKK